MDKLNDDCLHLVFKHLHPLHQLMWKQTNHRMSTYKPIITPYWYAEVIVAAHFDGKNLVANIASLGYGLSHELSKMLYYIISHYRELSVGYMNNMLMCTSIHTCSHSSNCLIELIMLSGNINLWQCAMAIYNIQPHRWSFGLVRACALRHIPFIYAGTDPLMIDIAIITGRLDLAETACRVAIYPYGSYRGGTPGLYKYPMGSVANMKTVLSYCISKIRMVVATELISYHIDVKDYEFASELVNNNSRHMREGACDISWLRSDMPIDIFRFMVICIVPPCSRKELRGKNILNYTGDSVEKFIILYNHLGHYWPCVMDHLFERGNPDLLQAHRDITTGIR